ncbi:uncharacterized protein LOC109503779 isoform X3 [Harpegnathos saltator]|uniref:uncharacterized protein LOC109503779 isoform X3 n=1 Tax=Harpegnathos saltator TaxID=610380 RepID=UPI000948AEBE|nr:uncharacterized protein LOC109503779 isoform X3 [Harpegnathos saltator]
MLWSFLVNVLANRKKGNTLPNNHYYIINQILLSAFHLWPYQCSRFIIINHIINLLLSLSFCFFQLTSFLTYQISMDLLIMVLSYAVPSFICTIQYCSFCIKSNAVKQILKDIHNSWSVLKNEMERDIMRKYSFSGQLCTILLFLCLVINLILYAFLQLLPDILNIINPLNETRPHQTYAVTEYFVDPKQYYYPILCHWLFSIFFNSSIMIATTTLHIVYVEHICGMLSVASYRIEHSIEKHASSNSTDKEASVIFQNISTAVELHRKAVQSMQHIFVNYFRARFFFNGCSQRIIFEFKLNASMYTSFLGYLQYVICFDNIRSIILLITSCSSCSKQYHC